jgi:hypothetical protein
MTQSLTTLSSKPLHDKAESVRQLYKKDSSTKAFLHRTITCRVLYLGSALIYPITSALDLLIGTILAVGALLTQGKYSCWNKQARVILFIGGCGIITSIFYSLLHVINPEALPIKKHSEVFFHEPDGTTHQYLAKFFKITGRAYKESDSVLERHLFSRVTYCVYTLSSPLSRIIDFVIGLFFAAYAISKKGASERLNRRALADLRVGCIVHDLYYGLLKTINPWAGNSIYQVTDH